MNLQGKDYVFQKAVGDAEWWFLCAPWNYFAPAGNFLKEFSFFLLHTMCFFLVESYTYTHPECTIEKDESARIV